MNTLDPRTTEFASGLLAALDEACVVVARDGTICAINDQAQSLLQGYDGQQTLQALFEDPAAVTDTISGALRTSGRRPATFRLAGAAPLRAMLTPVRNSGERPADYLLVRFSRRSDANDRLIRLRERIDRANRERRRLRAHNAALRDKVVEVVHLSHTDALTSLTNKRYFEREFQVEWQRAARTREPLALLIVDVDHFKRYNDHYGHQAGDTCLGMVATALASACVRRTDRVSRVGGEEFAVLAPATDIAGAARLAEKLREAVRAASLGHARAPEGRVTVSIGYGVAIPEEGSDRTGFYARVDRALYRAKSGGRDRAEPADHTVDPADSRPREVV